MATTVTWWVAGLLGTSLIWARMTITESGAAEVLGSDGRVLHYPDEDGARTALLDADFREFDGLDDDDASSMGFDLDSVQPPHAEDDDHLVPLLIQKI